MRIPVCGGYAWNKYSTNWWQIDPPLHYYLYSVEAIRLLCDRNKLFLEKVIYDSEPRQILVSEALNDTELSFDECIKKAKNSKESKKYWDLTDKLNEQYKGDQAVFYIRKKTT